MPSIEEGWVEMVDEEALEGDLDSFTDDKEAVEFPLTDRLLSAAEIKEDVDDDTEEVCWAVASWEEVQEEEGVS